MKEVQKVPQDLGHKPIISVEYDNIDKHFHEEKTDATALSIGLAQWTKELPVEERKILSLKVWRNTGERWSPQSEELPFYRNLDLTIFLLSVLLDENDVHFPEEKVSMKIDLPKRKNEIQQYRESIESRLKELKRLLNKFAIN